MNFSIFIMEARTPKFDPKRILIVLFGSIGDVTRGLPLANLLRRAFPSVFLAWSVEPAAFPLLQGNDAIDEILLFDRAHWRKTWATFLARIRAGRFDLVLDLQRHLKSGIISRWSGAPHRIGFHPRDSKEGNWLFNNLHIPRYGDEIAKLEHYLKFIDYMEIPRAPLEWRFNLSAEERAGVDCQLSKTSRKFAVFFVGARWQSKQWFPTQMAQCAAQLRREHGLDVVLLGGKEDQDLAQQVETLGATVTNLVGQTTLRHAIGIIERAKIALGPDTGLMHIAAAVQTPVISLWGATSPHRTGPYGFEDYVLQGQAACAPCNRRTCSIGRICLQSITAEQISAKVDLALRNYAEDPAAHARRD